MSCLFIFFFIICLSNKLCSYFISTNNYVNAYKELRKERQVAAEDVEYISILEGVLDETKKAKEDAIKNIASLDEQMVDVDCSLDIALVNLRAVKLNREIITIDEDSDDEREAPQSKKPRSEKRTNLSSRSADEISLAISDVFGENDTSQHADVITINSIVEEQKELE